MDTGNVVRDGEEEEEASSDGVNSFTAMGVGIASGIDGKWLGRRSGCCFEGSVEEGGRFPSGDVLPSSDV